MAASVRFEDEAFSDGRYDHLASLLGANRYEAMGRCAYLWRQCTQEQVYVLPESFVRVYVDPDKLCEARLGERVDGGIRIKGTDGRIEWLAEKRATSAAGGRARAAKAMREGGRFTSTPPASPGETHQHSTRTPPALTSAPAPAPAPAQLQETDKIARELRAYEIEQIGFSQNGQLAGPAQIAIRKLMPIHRDELEIALKAGGTAWKYTAKVLESMRAEAVRRSPPPIAQRTLTRTVSRQDQSFEQALAGVEAFNATRR